MRTWQAIVVTSVLSTTAVAGNVIVVGNGPGQFASLQDAVTVADDGDVVLVKIAGPFGSVRVQDKSVAIVNATGGTVQLNGALRVNNLAASRSVVLAGLNVTGTVSTTLPELGAGLRATACLGSVVAQDCTFTGGSSVGTTCNPVAPSHGVELLSSASVALTRCTITGGHGNSSYGQVPNEHPVQQGSGVRASTGSLVSLDTVTVSGGSGGSTCNSYQDGTHGGLGISLSNSSLFVCGSNVSGGAGSSPGGTVTGALVGSGGSGIDGQLVPASPVVSLASTVVGGLAGPPYFWCGLCASCCDGSPGSVTSGPLTLQTLAGAAKRLSGPSLVRDDETPEFRVDASPGERVEIAVSRAPTYQVDAGSGCILHVKDPNWIIVGLVPAGGNNVKRRYHMPDLPVTSPGQVFHVQARVTSTTGVRRLTNEQAVVLVDAAY